MEFKQAELDNGLKIIGETMPNAKSMAVGFFVRAGSRDETAEVSGVSHFLEHMMFKGTGRRSALEVNLAFDGMGAQYNASTSDETTMYFAAVLPEFQTAVLDLWTDLMRPSLRQDDFETEKGVICEEIAMYEDMPNFEVIKRCRELHFGAHGCGNTVLGTVESIRAMQRDQMKAYFDRRYSPDNMVLVGAGNLDWDALVAQAAEQCGQWPRAAASRTLTDVRGTGLRQTDTDGKVVRQHLCLMTQAPSVQSPLRYPAGLLATIIGSGSGSRFYWALIDTALADSASLRHDVMDGTGVFYAYISCDPARQEQVLDIATGILRDVRENGVTDDELTTAKNRISSAISLGGELPMGRLGHLGHNWLYRHEYRSLSEAIERVNAVSQDDIRALLADYPMKVVTIVGLGPPNGGAGQAATAAG